MLEQLAAPTVLPVSLATAKQWLRETSTDFDVDVTFILKAAFERAEKISHNAIVYRPVREQFDYFLPYFELSGYPVLGVTAIQYLDSQGALQTLAPSTYIVDVTKGQARITPQYALYFPPTRVIMNSVRIYYDMGLMVPVTAMDNVTNIITAPGHNKAAGDIVQFSTDGGVLSNVVAGTSYYCLNPTANTLQVSATSGGSVFALGATFAAPAFIGVLPNDFAQAVRLMVGAWYNFPEDVVAANVKDLPSHGAEALLQSYMPRGF